MGDIITQAASRETVYSSLKVPQSKKDRRTASKS
eukprot:CAMPEP_0185576824 /NCGR_PEP_ID=MMETSP0434-20130131/7672_1 /TAXON_ID=626734 ORGANISM="Favella taraikaensis, Strain Fe Narragansett Bay" /NCGR_SAMPLE_ID=MMETSP0434 /ASSEMBLY_ACC=CAM_ASM_000379 /LENGTH=33 /DNA_ID= /DNA_START= /DNA_END= /DNA_ORIENTATION=